MAISDKVKGAGEQAKKAMTERKTEAAGAARKAQAKGRAKVDEARKSAPKRGS
jgi:hypothetical protein